MCFLNHINRRVIRSFSQNYKQIGTWMEKENQFVYRSDWQGGKPVKTTPLWRVDTRESTFVLH